MKRSGKGKRKRESGGRRRDASEKRQKSRRNCLTKTLKLR